MFKSKNNFFAGLLFIILVSTVAHFFFSHLGFNPTDDGFILAGSRRILDGQIPHRDFISIRTAGSHMLHTPFVLFGGDYAIWISRYFVWIEFACIAWVWMLIIGKVFGTFKTTAHKFTFALIAFCLSVHNFPIMAWHSIDALFMASVGLILCYSPVGSQTDWLKKVGYLIIGISPLLRQNFLLLIPASIVILNDWREKRYWILAILPTVVYICYLAFNGAISDAVLQLSTYDLRDFLGLSSLSLWYLLKDFCLVRDLLGLGILWYTARNLYLGVFFGGMMTLIYLIRDILGVGLSWYLPDGLYWGILLGYMIVFSFKLQSLVKKIGLLVLYLTASRIMSYLWMSEGQDFRYICFAVFGIVIGILYHLISDERKITPQIRGGLLILAIAWITLLSKGYSTPALTLGPLVLWLIAFGISRSELTGKSAFITLLTILLLVVTLVSFVEVRENRIYRETTAANLTYELGDVVQGGGLIRTDQNTYTALKDLQNAEEMALKRGMHYCIIPDMAFNWIKSQQPNPLPIDWPQNTELGRQELVDRAVASLETQRGSLVVIVQKYEASTISGKFEPLSSSYTIVQYVRSHFNKTGETQFFEFYE